MLSPEAVLQVIDALNDSGSPYILTGSLATNLYRPPRSTMDGDFVVEMNANQLEQLFRRLGALFDREPQMAFETVTGKLQHKLRHRESKFLIEIFEANMDDPHERARFERRRIAQIDGRSGYVTTAEDVLVQKLRWFARIRRDKDRGDILMVMASRWDALDWAYIEGWCHEHQSLEMMRQLKAIAPCSSFSTSTARSC